MVFLLEEVETHKHLGVTFSADGTWHDLVEITKQKAWKRVNILRPLKFMLDRKTLTTIYTSFIRPILEYSDVVWDNITQQEVNDLEKKYRSNLLELYLMLQSLSPWKNCTKKYALKHSNHTGENTNLSSTTK